MDAKALLLILGGLYLLTQSNSANASYNTAEAQPGGLDFTDFIFTNPDTGQQVTPLPDGTFQDVATGEILDPSQVIDTPTPDTSPSVTGDPPETTLDDSEIPAPPADGTGIMTVSYNMQNQNVAAFLQMIRHGESRDGNDAAYNMIVFGGTFSSYADHPRIYKSIPGTTKKTSAAGAYQITATTWDDLQSSLHLPDFSPTSQDAAAVALIKRRGALDDVIQGNWESAIAKCQKEWTSLPGAAEQRYSMATAKMILAQYGGSAPTTYVT